MELKPLKTPKQSLPLLSQSISLVFIEFGIFY